jgi:succinate-semialdehyde dehydrogenase/glutarate-semialdehyde dehydrogenase
MPSSPSIQSVNPSTGQVLETFVPTAPEAVTMALNAARRAYAAWRETAYDERAALLRRVAVLLREREGELARIATLEMGKPITEAEAEVEKCAWGCEFYAAQGAGFLAREPVATNASESYVEFVPLGVVMAIMPWNFPYWQVFRFAAPALMAGNTVVLKHASNVSRCALEIERILRDAGRAATAPDGLFHTLLLPGAAVEPLIADPRVAAVTLTGSTPAGSAVAAAAGRAIKKTVLELGGSDYFLVLEDADLDAAAETAVRSRFQNTGQSCIAAKRFIVVEAVADAFERRLIERTASLRVGDPLDPATQVGPLARADLRAALDRQVRESVTEGARAALTGARLNPRYADGYFYLPTVLTAVTPQMPVFREETFGPVAPVIRARDAEHAVALSNDTLFGLGGNLWTRDLDRARTLARRLESGNVFINGMTASDPRLPFGGVKQSGYGRELAAFGIREFVNVQTVWIGPATAPTGAATMPAPSVPAE